MAVVFQHIVELQAGTDTELIGMICPESAKTALNHQAAKNPSIQLAKRLKIYIFLQIIESYDRINIHS